MTAFAICTAYRTVASCSASTTCAVMGGDASLPTTRRSAPARLRDLADVDSRFTYIAGVMVHHKLWKKRQNEDHTVVCVHGFGSNLFSFEKCQSGSSYSMAAMDVPGFGLTQRPSLRHLWRYSSPYAATLLNQLPVHGDRVLVGHSMGALVAVQAAAQQRVRGIILIAPAVIVPSSSSLWKSITRIVSPIFAIIIVLITVLLSPVLSLIIRTNVSKRSFWQNGLDLARGDGVTPPDIIDGYMRPLGAVGWERGILNFARMMIVYRATRANDGLRYLKEIARDTPILIVHGENDRIIPIANSRALRQLIPKIELREIPKAGHLVQEECPEQFASIVDSFVAQLTAD